MKQFARYGICAALVLALALPLPGCSSKRGEGGVVATVNGEPIYLKDLKRELSNRVNQNPSLEITKETIDDLIDTLVKRQLIIQEAMGKKLAEEQRFVDTIKTFWEQTLIKNFVEYKIGEFDRYVFVTDKEIENYYNVLKEKVENMPPLEEAKERVREIIKQEKKAKALDDWLMEKKEKAKISINKAEIEKELLK